MLLSLLSTSLLVACFQVHAHTPEGHGIGSAGQKRNGGHRVAARFVEERDSGGGGLEKRSFTGRCTFYYTSVGAGACGTVHPDSDWTVAMNTNQFNSGSVCGQYITLTYNGATGTALIADECPSCSYGEIDLSPSFFQNFASEDAGEFDGTWNFGSGAAATTTSSSAYTPPTTSSTPAYTPPTTTSSSTPAWTPPTTSSTPAYTPPTTSSTSTSTSSSPSPSSSAWSSAQSSSAGVSGSGLASGSGSAYASSAGASASSSSSSSAGSSASASTTNDGTGTLEKMANLLNGLGKVVCTGNENCEAN